MGTNPTYSEEQILDRIKEHCIDNHMSKYTMAYPTWQGVLKRLKENPEFEDKVNTLLALADQWWEKKGQEALHDKDFNNVMYAKLTNSKPFTKDHAAVEVEERISRIEEELESRVK